MNKFVNYIILTFCVAFGSFVPVVIGIEQMFGPWSFLGGVIGLFIGVLISVRVARR